MIEENSLIKKVIIPYVTFNDPWGNSSFIKNMCIYNVSIHIKFGYYQILNEKDIQEISSLWQKVDFKHKSDLIWPSMTAEVILN